LTDVTICVRYQMCTNPSGAFERKKGEGVPFFRGKKSDLVVGKGGLVKNPGVLSRTRLAHNPGSHAPLYLEEKKKERL